MVCAAAIGLVLLRCVVLNHAPVYHAPLKHVHQPLTPPLHRAANPKRHTNERQLTGGADGGVHVTDASNASRTNLLDLRSRQWHPPFVQLFGLTPAALPRVASNSEVLGYVKAGPLAGVPISGCLGDQQAALVGQRCGVGEAKNTYGTGCFMLLNTGERERERGLCCC